MKKGSSVVNFRLGRVEQKKKDGWVEMTEASSKKEPKAKSTDGEVKKKIKPISAKRTVK